MFNFISQEPKFIEISKNIDKSFLTGDFKYSRSKEKTDKSLEIYKFYINALYVAITRSTCNVYIIEQNINNDFLKLLNINEINEVNIKAEQSSLEEWQREASKLAVHGKNEQVKAIEESILKREKASCIPFDIERYKEQKNKILEQNSTNKKETIILLN